MTTKVDIITREVIWRRLIGVCDEMATVLLKTCYSPMIRDARDYTTGLVDFKGRTIAQNSAGLPSHFNEIGERVVDGIRTYGLEGMRSGDAIMVNHTAVTGQHINNVQIYAPVVLTSGKVIGFSACDAHWQDVGGITANRPTGGTIDCFQEGLQVRSVKVYREGVPDEEILRLMSGNLRRPDVGLADLRSQVASCLAGAKGFLHLVEEFSVEGIFDAVEGVWEEAELTAREAIRRIPDGVYEASSFLDDDAFDPDKEVPIEVRVTIRDDECEVDLTGIGDQARGPINSRSNAPINVGFKALTNPDTSLSLGEFRPLNVIVREGSFMRAKPGAPMGSWSWPFATVLDTFLKALEPALPGKIPAGNCGVYYGAGFFFGTDPDTGKIFTALGLLPMGWGGRPNGDGATAHALMLPQIQDTPAEVHEALYPMEIERYSLRTDSAGAGRYRGGLGVEYVVRCNCDTFVSFELDRTKCLPWGLHGGQSGKPGYHKVILPDGTEQFPPRRAVNYLVPAGGRVVVATGGGGGYGNPLERPRAEVIDDLFDGYVSLEGALNDYALRLDDISSKDRTMLDRYTRR